MVFIFEGQDRTGKSTQIDFLKGFLSYKKFLVLHFSQVKSLLNNIELYEDYSKSLYKEGFKFLKRNYISFDLILDRFHLGESVYSPIYRKYSGDYVFDLEKKYLNEDMQNFIYLLVFIDSKEDNLIKREDGLSIVDENGNRFLYKEKNLFIESYEKSLIKNKILIDISKYDNEKLISEQIVNFISKIWSNT